ncbi:MAG: 30S ribosome-binding factor RbfA [Candidatus Paracaedibacteraceae bacterium]|nr:30S ribosome-binding factor RbfA [Candidatus Paracaedibacteraceae bacterium]
MSFHKKGIGKKTSPNMPSQRQLRVGEDLRHLIAKVFMHGEVYHPILEGKSITVTCVSASPDLRKASVFVLPLGIYEPEEIKKLIDCLNEVSSQIRHAIAPKITFKYVPQLIFQEDTSFSYGSRIEALISKNIKEN